MRHYPGLFLSLLLCTPLLCHAASNDNAVEWNGVHHNYSMRSPEWPTSGQSFTVDLEVFSNDLTAVTLTLTTASGTTNHAMAVSGSSGGSGQYDVYSATISATGNYAYYYFTLTDGSDTDYYNRAGMSVGTPTDGHFLINLTSLGQYPPGVTTVGTSSAFRVWAPNADSVTLNFRPGTAFYQQFSMTNIEGFWQVLVPGARRNHTYEYEIVNGASTYYRKDPRAYNNDNTTGYSIIYNNDYYQWGDAGWVTPPFEEMIVSEVHLGTFLGGGDGITAHPGNFRDVVDAHLDHLVESGINVIELMPISEFPGDISWGYNPVFLYAPETAYGNPDDLKYLIDKAHQAGLAVILDVVFNHMSATDLGGNIWEYDGPDNIYFYPSGSPYEDTPWGKRPDYSKIEVRDWILDSMTYFVEHFHVDGYRIDSTEYIKNQPTNPDGFKLIREMTRYIDIASDKAILITEQLPSSADVTNSWDSGGGGLDSQWNDPFHDNLRQAVNDMAGLGDPYMQGIVDGMNHFGFGGYQAVNYLESHDETNVHGRTTVIADGSNPHSIYAHSRAKLVYGLIMYTSGIPMILMGQEWAEDKPYGDAQADDIQWGYKTTYNDFFLACRDMTWLRRESTALHGSSYQNVYHFNEGGNVIVWERYGGGTDNVVIAANFSDADYGSYCIGMPANGTWYEAINTNRSEYGGGGTYLNGTINVTNGSGIHGMPYQHCIALPARSIVVLTRIDYPMTPDLDADNDLMPNSYESANGLDPNQASDSDDDPDGDGDTNIEEYITGTDPNLSTSYFMAPISVATGLAQISFPTLSGRDYHVQFYDAGTGYTWQTQQSISGDGTLKMYTEPSVAPGGLRLIRVVVELL